MIYEYRYFTILQRFIQLCTKNAKNAGEERLFSRYGSPLANILPYHIGSCPCDLTGLMVYGFAVRLHTSTPTFLHMFTFYVCVGWVTASSNLKRTAIYTYYRPRPRLVFVLFSDAPLVIKGNPCSRAHSLLNLSILPARTQYQ